MKKNSIIITIYSLAYIIYILFTYLIKSVKGSNYWIGFAFTTLAFILIIIFGVLANDRRSFASPMDISIMILSNIYLISTIIINIKCGQAVKIGEEIENLESTDQFLIYEFVCLLIFAVLFFALGLNKKHTIKVNSKISKELNDRHDLIAKLEILIEKVTIYGNHKRLAKKLESLADDIRFCNIDSNLEDRDLNDIIDANIKKLENEINNIIEIDTTDYSSIEDIIFSIKEQLIKKERRAAR